MMLARLFVALQYVLPQHWLTAVMWRIARIRQPRLKNFLIMRFVAAFDLNLDEVRRRVPEDFETFNDFFIRELHETARPVAAAERAIVSPVDGQLSAHGTIREQQLIQAKGIRYSLDDLLATDLAEAREFSDGEFATIYLAPFNYHRVHAPVDGELVNANYVPGDLFSVNENTATHVDGLLRRNERLVLRFDTATGPFVLIFVGALMVGSISTPWTREVRPRKKGTVEIFDISSHPTTVRKGDLLGWFNMGSTVVMLLPPGANRWNDDFANGTTVKMGEAIGELTATAT